MSDVTGTLTVRATSGETTDTVARRALHLAGELPLVDVSFEHNDTTVRVFGDDTVLTACRRWAKERSEA